jgi:hypothetical protein
MRSLFDVHRSTLATVVLAVCAAAAPGAAQDRTFRQETNPFQADFDYVVNSELEPLVEVDGVRWLRFAVRTREGRDIDLSKSNPVTVELEVDPGTENDATVLLIVLFEDAHGNALERLACEPARSGRGRISQLSQKHKVDGRVLEATRRVYLYFEVTR